MLDRPKTGQDLENDILNLQITRRPLIQEFLYERDIFLLSADAGVGKSTIITQLVLCLSSGYPLFNALTTRPTRVYVLQAEGDYEESVERMRYMRKTIPMDSSNVCWDHFKYLDISSDASIRNVLKRIGDTFKPEVIILDPLYKLTKFDVAEGNGALQVVRFSDILAETYGCTNLLVHHNTKESFFMVEGKRFQKTDAFYGHSFIKNHVRTSYSLFHKAQNMSSPILSRKKGRGADTIDTIYLTYDPESMTCISASESMRALERIESQAKVCLKDNRVTDFYEISEKCELSHSHLRKLKAGGELNTIFDFIPASGRRRELWKPKQSLQELQEKVI